MSTGSQLSWQPSLLRYRVQNSAAPYHAIPYHTIPYHTTPQHTTPHHTTLYHSTAAQTLRVLMSILKKVHLSYKVYKRRAYENSRSCENVVFIFWFVFWYCCSTAVQYQLRISIGISQSARCALVYKCSLF